MGCLLCRPWHRFRAFGTDEAISEDQSLSGHVPHSQEDLLGQESKKASQVDPRGLFIFSTDLDITLRNE